MVAYPAYTIDGIEKGLSWRQVRKLLSYWEATPPMSRNLGRIETMLEKKFGIKFESTKPMKQEELVRKLEEFGWL